MLTAARAWMGATEGHGGGFSKSRRRKLLDRSAQQLHGEIVKQDVELWYSRRKAKKKKKAIGKGAEESDATKKMEVDSSRCVCSDCGTSRTPLWRRGPSGPKSLCNACGIRYRKTSKTPSALKDEELCQKREALWLLMEESKEAVEAAMLLMAMSSGLLSFL